MKDIITTKSEEYQTCSAELIEKIMSGIVKDIFFSFVFNIYELGTKPIHSIFF